MRTQSLATYSSSTNISKIVKQRKSDQKSHFNTELNSPTRLKIFHNNNQTIQMTVWPVVICDCSPFFSLLMIITLFNAAFDREYSFFCPCLFLIFLPFLFGRPYSWFSYLSWSLSCIHFLFFHDDFSLLEGRLTNYPNNCALTIRFFLIFYCVRLLLFYSWCRSAFLVKIPPHRDSV